MPTHFRLDENGDLDISDGTWHLVTGREAIAQDCQTALRAFLGEYFLGRASVGTDWYGEVFQDGASLAAIEALIADKLRSREGVLNVETLVLGIDRVSTERVLDVDFTLNTIEGIVTAADVIGLPGPREFI